ncbi:MAG: carboxypeptidase-like regulatory domain-containing protein, partial [Verrucomicrobiales bacterium]|nr:carboxypeptidase-like regulatory domain-containing protein [Verrucomicrobiales bacterium]
MHKLLGLLLLGVTVSAYASQFTTIGGAAVDDAGQPVADATVFISGKGVNSTVCGAMSVFTNSEGKWRYDRITPGIKSVRLGVWHPQFAPNHNGGSYDLTEYDDMPSLLAGTHTLTLRRGVTISGLVTDSAGRPVSGAEITYGRDSNASNALPTQFTGADGRFTLASLPDSVAYLTVKAAGFAPGQKHLYVKDRPLTVTIQLPAPLTLSGRVVNASGQPVKDANVYLDTWRGTRTLKVRLTTDADGRFTYADAPADDIKVLAYGKGYAGSEVTVSAGRDNIITLQNPTSVSGTVFDAVTNQPIPAFTIVRGLCFGDSPLISWQKHVTVSGSNGAFTVPDLTEYWGHDNTAHAFRVSADGYA